MKLQKQNKIHKLYRLSLKVLWLPVCFFLLLFPLFSHAGEDKPAAKTPSEVAPSDSIPETPVRYNNMEEKLRDPDYDIRLPSGGKLQPWHDRNSMYPRRTLPINQLA